MRPIQMTLQDHLYQHCYFTISDSGDYEHIYSEIYEDFPPPIPLPLQKPQNYEIAKSAKKDSNEKGEQQALSQYVYTKQPIYVVGEEHDKYSQMHRSSTPIECVRLQVRNSDGHGIYIAKDQQITIDKCEGCE